MICLSSEVSLEDAEPKIRELSSSRERTSAFNSCKVLSCFKYEFLAIPPPSKSGFKSSAIWDCNLNDSFTDKTGGELIIELGFAVIDHAH